MCACMAQDSAAAAAAGYWHRSVGTVGHAEKQNRENPLGSKDVYFHPVHDIDPSAALRDFLPSTAFRFRPEPTSITATSSSAEGHRRNVAAGVRSVHVLAYTRRRPPPPPCVLCSGLSHNRVRGPVDGRANKRIAPSLRQVRQRNRQAAAGGGGGWARDRENEKLVSAMSARERRK